MSTSISGEEGFDGCELGVGSVFDAEARVNLHDILDGVGVEEAEEQCGYQGEEGDEVP